MRFYKINTHNAHKMILIGLIIVMILVLNLFLMNKLISGHETERSLERAIKIK